MPKHFRKSTTVKDLSKDRWSDIDGGKAFIIPLTALRHDNFKRLTPYAIKLMMDLARQYTGHNNGYLCPAWTLMKDEGWASRDTLFWAVRELEHYRWLRLSRQGSRNRANLYAFTFRRIDEKLNQPDNALDVTPSLLPSNAWKDAVEPFQKPPRKPHKTWRASTRCVSPSHVVRVNGSSVNTHGV